LKENHNMLVWYSEADTYTTPHICNKNFTQTPFG